MPRKPRLFLPDQPQHVVVRGHNRSPILKHHEDFRFLYRCLKKASAKHHLAVHAWVFMHNHVHLLLTPSDKNSIAKTMQSIGRRYAQYFNQRYQRTGSLWQGRYQSSLVDTEHYLLSCYRYIEMNPVRAGIVQHPEDYPYSSFGSNALANADSLIQNHPVYLSLINNGISAYQQLFEKGLSSQELAVIRGGTESGAGIGKNEFLLKIAGLSNSRNARSQ